MLPAKTIEKLGASTITGIADRLNVKAHDDYAIQGYELHELAVLAVRLNERLDPDEARDWQNRLNLLVDNVKSRPIY